MKVPCEVQIFRVADAVSKSDRSIYVVVFDCTKDLEQYHTRLEYWLRQINLLVCNRPPIRMVGTHCNQHHEASIAALTASAESCYRKPWCGHMRGIHCMSCVKCIGLDDSET